MVLVRPRRDVVAPVEVVNGRRESRCMSRVWAPLGVAVEGGRLPGAGAPVLGDDVDGPGTGGPLESGAEEEQRRRGDPEEGGRA